MTDLRPARPTRRRATPDAAPSPEDVQARLARLEASMTQGFADLARMAEATAHRFEEVVELLESTIDHLVSIERRLDASKPTPASVKKAAAKKAVTAKKAPAAAAAPRRRPARKPTT